MAIFDSSVKGLTLPLTDSNHQGEMMRFNNLKTQLQASEGEK